MKSQKRMIYKLLFISFLRRWAIIIIQATFFNAVTVLIKSSLQFSIWN